jgi:hypothetical protein
MKVGVVTWFKYENYGTVLQAIALQNYLKKLNYNVELINFSLDDSINIKKNKFDNIFSRVILKLNKIFFKKDFEKKSSSFKKIINDNCILSNYINSDDEYIKICNKYDVIIFGSDQIWNQNWYHSYYYANFDEIKTCKISYAPSFGNSKICDIDKLKKILSKFYKISIREEKEQDILKNIINRDVDVVVDPTLLLNIKDWEQYEEKYSIKYNNYILCYMLTDNKNHWKAIKNYAKLNGKKIIIIPHEGLSYIVDKNVIRDCSVGNFLYLIKNAYMVFTDSFHACVFSLIYRKKFYVFERHNPLNENNQNSRIYNLLKMAKCEQCLIKYNSNSFSEPEELDYSKFYDNLKDKIIFSKKYLKDSLEEVKNGKK